MPGGDGSGPRGMGSGTGRGAGYCAGYSRPGYANPVRRGFGGRGARFGGYGRGRAGFGRRGRWDDFFDDYNYDAFGAYQPPNKEQQLSELREQAKYLERVGEDLKRKIDELEQEK